MLCRVHELLFPRLSPHIMSIQLWKTSRSENVLWSIAIEHPEIMLIAVIMNMIDITGPVDHWSLIISYFRLQLKGPYVTTHCITNLCMAESQLDCILHVISLASTDMDSLVSGTA